MDGTSRKLIELASARTGGAPPSPMPVVMSPEVERIVDSLYRTEDIAVAPDGRRVVIPGFFSDHMVLADLDVVADAAGTSLHVSNVSVVQCEQLRHPHGVAFLDESTVLVANRGAELMVIDVPSRDAGASTVFRKGRVLVGEHDPVPVCAPSSLAVRHAGALAEVLVCNNDSDNVTRYVFDLDDDLRVIDREVLIDDGLSTPDGIAISSSGRWLAVSNHSTHEVFVFAYEPDAEEAVRRVGTLRGSNYPHGVRFANDDRTVFLNDAGLPFLYVYASGDGEWAGVRDPVRTLRVMDDDTFNSGRYNPQEGGPKGLVVLEAQGVVVQTSTHQHLACLPLDAVLDRAADGAADAPSGDPTPAPEPVAVDAATSDLVRRSLRRLHETEEGLAASRHRAAGLEHELTEHRRRVDELEQLYLDASATADAVERTLSELRAENESMRTRLDVLTDQVERTGAELHEVSHELQRAEAELTSMRDSTCWRLTRPIRRVLDLVRRRP